MQLLSREPLIFELSRTGRGATTQFPAAASGGIGTAGRAPFYAAVADEFFHRHALLSFGFLHHEVQPEGVQRVRDAAGVFGQAPARAGTARVSRLHVRTAG